MSFVHYRVSTLGIELEETLQEFLREKVVDVDLLEVIRKEFDKAMVTVLKKMVKDKPVLKGKLKHYQNCENVWIFHIANPEIRVSNYSLPIQMNGPLKIVGCDSKLITSLERKKEKKGKKIRVRK
mmetsp:Transcript_121001/g.180750  ORF Transcript_121001/g.180750 Transcript_121001/m.180750 type:complete len:125 (+) Transcript_121001:1650-2024(+)